MSKRANAFLAALALALSAAPPAHAQINSVTTSSSGQEDKVAFDGINLFRGGEPFSYDYEELIRGSVTAINIPGAFRTIILSADGYPAGGAPNALLDDPYLNTGMLTPGLGDGAFASGDEFTEYTFDQPVSNEPGDDLLLSFITFKFDTWESDPGPYWLAPDGGTPTQIDREADIDLSAVAGIPYYRYLAGGPDEPSDLLSTAVQPTGSLGNSNATPRPSLQLVDLTELGVPAGEAIESLRIWDDNFSNGNSIYPTMIAGFPLPPSIAADFDDDLEVDGVDLLAWKIGFGTAGNATKYDGDADADRDADGADLLIWQRELGLTVSLQAAAAPIPEPAALQLIGALLAFIPARRRRIPSPPFANRAPTPWRRGSHRVACPRPRGHA